MSLLDLVYENANERTAKVSKGIMKKILDFDDVTQSEIISYLRDEPDSVVEKIENINQSRSPNTKKNYYATLVGFLRQLEDENVKAKLDDGAKIELAEGFPDIYRDKMLDLCATMNQQSKKQEKTQKQEDNWLSLEELNKIVKEHKRKALDAIKREGTTNFYSELQPYFVASLYLADEKNPPLRNEYGDMYITHDIRIANEDVKHNYLVITGRNKKEIILNDFKTKKTQGQKRFRVGSKLNTIMNVLLKHHPFLTDNHPTQPLLLNSNGAMLGRNGLTKYMQARVFNKNGKKLSSAMLRHIYISAHLPQPPIAEKQELADKMCHTIGVQEEYIKH